MTTVGVVILHYMALEMTVRCIELLRTTFHNQAEIVVVDNASPNGTGEKLKKKYDAEEHITVLLNKENVGFARGNNVGYDFLKENFDLSFMIVMNNDVLIRQEDFLERIKKVYEDTHFDVLGPDIYNTVLKLHQNPSRLDQMSEKEVSYWIDRFKRVEKHYFTSFIKMKICDFRNKIVPLKLPNIDRTTVHENPVLHGACYIFSGNYIENRDYAFFPKTFLYGEEDILAFQCKKMNLRTIYSSYLSVEHLEDVSTNLAFRNEYAKQKMKNSQMLKSYKLLYELMREK